MKNITLMPSKNKNGTYGLHNIEDNLVFYKDNVKYVNELDNMSSLDFKYSPVIFVDKKTNTSYFEFDKDLYLNTLYDSLYFNGKYWNKRYEWFKKLENSINNNYKLLSFNESKSKKFFIDRIGLINESKKYSKNVKIIEEVENFINNINDYIFRAYISNGDLTDTNICFNNKICDTECLGYNIVIADLSILFVSILYGSWIYPKYNYNAYLFRKNKIIVPEKRLNRKQIDIIKIILRLVKPVEFNTFKKLIIMRLITPITMEMMEEIDYKSVDDLIRIIYISEYDTIISNIIKYYKKNK